MLLYTYTYLHILSHIASTHIIIYTPTLARNIKSIPLLMHMTGLTTRFTEGPTLPGIQQSAHKVTFHPFAPIPLHWVGNAPSSIWARTRLSIQYNQTRHCILTHNISDKCQYVMHKPKIDVRCSPHLNVLFGIRLFKTNPIWIEGS